MDFLDIPDEILAQRYPGQDIGLLKEAYRQAQAVKSGQAEKSAKPVTETIKTDPGTGEQTVTISGSPHDLSPANPLTPTVVNPVAPSAPVASARPQMVAPQQPVRPVNPAEAYNQYTQQQESGANPNIGYHNPQQSTAYGAYGITQPQYQEIQKQNPQFAGRDIASLSPEEQAQANATSHDVYANQLKAKGVEPTEENIRLAHFLGAGGAHQFLNNGAISPQAAAANGGEDKARQIALARLNGPVNPNQAPPMIAGNASSDVGLTPTEQAISQMNKKPSVDQVASDAIVAAGNNPTKLYALAGNEDFPENFRNIARDMALQHDKFANKQKEVLGNFEDAANGSASAANKMLKSLRSPGEEGSLTKAVLLGLIGARSLAKEEFQKYSGNYYKISSATLDNENFTIQSDPKGAIVKAYDKKGVPVSDEKLAELNARNMADLHVSKVTNKINPTTGEEVTEQTLSNGQTRYMQGGEIYTGDKAKLTGADEYIRAEDRKVLAADNNLRKNYPNPTDEQRYQALRKAGVSERRIKEEFGINTQTAPNAERKEIQTGTQVERAVTNAAETKKPQVGSTTLPSGRPFDPNHAPEQALPGQSTESHKADVAAWKDREKLYTKQVDAIPTLRNNASETLADIDRLLQHPGLAGNLGKTGMLPNIPGSDASNARALIEKIKGGSFLNSIQSMKGFGSLSDAEGKKIQAAAAALSLSQSEDEFRRNLINYSNAVKRSVNTFDSKIGEDPDYPDAPKAGESNNNTGTTSSGNKFKRVSQ